MTNGTDSVFVAAYWPFFKTHEQRKFHYVAEDGSMSPFTSFFTYDLVTDSMLYNDYDENDAWKNCWFYQYRPGFVIAEWRDDYPQDNSYLAKTFGNVKKKVMSTPILWGDYVHIGQVVTNKPRVSLTGSTPPQMGFASQSVLFEQILPDMVVQGVTYQDVLQFVYQQQWGNEDAHGARYWMAKGVGPIALQWVSPTPKTGSPLVTTARMLATVTST